MCLWWKLGKVLSVVSSLAKDEISYQPRVGEDFRNLMRKEKVRNSPLSEKNRKIGLSGSPISPWKLGDSGWVHEFFQLHSVIHGRVGYVLEGQRMFLLSGTLWRAGKTKHEQ